MNIFSTFENTLKHENSETRTYYHIDFKIEKSKNNKKLPN